MKRTLTNRPGASRRAFTLVEMLVTVTVTMMVMLAMIQAFQWVGQRVSMNRAVIETMSAMRGVGARLQQDLDNITIPVRPWPSQDYAGGYFEYIEGSMTDSTAAANSPFTKNTFANVGVSFFGNTAGDFDDYVAMTVHSYGDPFIGRGDPFTDTNLNGVRDNGETFIDVNGNGNYDATFTSHDAEVAWWTSWDDLNQDNVAQPQELVLRRRVLLIRPDLSLAGVSFSDFFQNNDISAHPDTLPNSGTTPNVMVPNTLASLTLRENRFGHDPRVVSTNPNNSNTPFPFVVRTTTLKGLRLGFVNPAIPTGFYGSDIVASNVLSFDVRAFDPVALIEQTSNAGGPAVTPTDSGWTINPATTLGRGAFVDLGYNKSALSIFSGLPRLPCPNHNTFTWKDASNNNLIMPTYDTWSFTYEEDGIDTDGVNGTDGGTDGLDNDSVNGVDNLEESYIDNNGNGQWDSGTDTLVGDLNGNGTWDAGERETSPPYPVPLRGLQIKFRMYEPDTRQLKQLTVISDFTPE